MIIDYHNEHVDAYSTVKITSTLCWTAAEITDCLENSFQWLAYSPSEKLCHLRFKTATVSQLSSQRSYQIHEAPFNLPDWRQQHWLNPSSSIKFLSKWFSQQLQTKLVASNSLSNKGERDKTFLEMQPVLSCKFMFTMTDYQIFNPKLIGILYSSLRQLQGRNVYFNICKQSFVAQCKHFDLTYSQKLWLYSR